MAVTSITGAAGQTTTAANNLAGISGEDFMQVLIKQLQYQDPLKPMDNEQMVQQMATIRRAGDEYTVQHKLSQLTDQQRFAGAAALIGKHVKGMLQDDNGNHYPAEGVVKRITFTDKGEVMLDLDNGQQLPLSKLQEVADATASTTTGQVTPVNATASSSTTEKPSLGSRLIDTLVEG